MIAALYSYLYLLALFLPSTQCRWRRAVMLHEDHLSGKEERKDFVQHASMHHAVIFPCYRKAIATADPFHQG
jgi:hypothetical protein